MVFDKFFKKILEEIKPSEEETEKINDFVRFFIKDIENKIKKNHIKAEVFIGGSVAKNTLIKKQKYDADIFVRFDKKYSEKELNRLLSKIVPHKAVKKHGSREYYSYPEKEIEFEIIPTFKIAKPEEAVNITDLSYFHVNYIKKNIEKNKKLSDEIRLAKAFAYYQECYGAESYINGFSGYAIELLIIHYKTFLNFVKNMAKLEINKKKLFIDIAKIYKDEKSAIEEMNSSKLNSPILLVDPTFKDRNVLAALSYETFKRFQRQCKNFLRNPSEKFFEFEDIETKLEKKYKNNLHKIFIKTNKQEGDIAGTKLKKFYEYFSKQTAERFIIRDRYFSYDSSKTGAMFFVVSMKKLIEKNGPPIGMKIAVKKFRQTNKKSKIVVKRGVLYALTKNKIDFEHFLENFKKKNKKIIKEMFIEFV